MTVSSFIRWLVRIFELLETHIVPAARSGVHLVRTGCALLPEKLDLLRIRFLFRLADLRAQLAHGRHAPRFRIQNEHLHRFGCWLRSACVDALIYGLSACALLALWRFAFRL